MKQLLQEGFLREAGLFIGAGAIAMTIKSMQKPVVHHCLVKHPHLATSPFARTLSALHSLQDERMFDMIVSKISDFMKFVKNGSAVDGFYANRLAAEIPTLVNDLVRNAKYSRDLEVAVMAIDFEQDELLSLPSLFDDMVRNMLLDAKPY